MKSAHCLTATGVFLRCALACDESRGSPAGPLRSGTIAAYLHATMVLPSALIPTVQKRFTSRAVERTRVDGPAIALPFERTRDESRSALRLLQTRKGQS